jgi:predicted ester cyclase
MGARGGGFQLSLVLQIVASDGEMVGSRTTTTGTHQNALMGIRPTGRAAKHRVGGSNPVTTQRSAARCAGDAHSLIRMT